VICPSAPCGAHNKSAHTRCTKYELTNHRELAMWLISPIRHARGCS